MPEKYGPTCKVYCYCFPFRIYMLTAESIKLWILNHRICLVLHFLFRSFSSVFALFFIFFLCAYV